MNEASEEIGSMITCAAICRLINFQKSTDSKHHTKRSLHTLPHLPSRTASHYTTLCSLWERPPQTGTSYSLLAFSGYSSIPGVSPWTASGTRHLIEEVCQERQRNHIFCLGRAWRCVFTSKLQGGSKRADALASQIGEIVNKTRRNGRYKD
jgi:hypothetical protein